MPVTSNVNNIYKYNGSLQDITLGEVLDTSVFNSTEGALNGTFRDNNGHLTQHDDSSATFQLAGGSRAPINYVGSGTVQILTILGVEIDSRPVTVFESDGQIFVYAPDGLPFLSDLLIDFDINQRAGFTLPGARNGWVDGLDTGQTMGVGYTDRQGEQSSNSNDRIDGHGGNDRIYAGGGNDVVLGGTGNDVIRGGAGNDAIKGEAGGDRLYGGTGIDTLSYSGSKAGVKVDLGNNTAAGGHANGDMIAGFENLRGSGHADVLTGSGGANRIIGANGNDVIHGGGGNDRLNGGNGNDVLNGGNGNDLLNGGFRQDVLRGGGGEDTFKFFSTADSRASSGRDIIKDFQGAGQHAASVIEDKIDLSEIDANTTISGNQSFSFNGTTAGGAGKIWVRNHDGETWIHVNTDNDADVEMAIRLQDGSTTASDYWSGDFIL